MLSLLEKILGAGIKRAHENYYFNCPKCKHHKPKLNINLNENSNHYQNYNCFVCGWKGKTIYSLFKSLQVPSIYFEKLSQLVKNNYNIPEIENHEVIKLPEEYIPLSNIPKNRFEKINFDIAKKYIYSRGLTAIDILKYNIGICIDGIYANTIIIPSYDKNKELNYFVSRNYLGTGYKNPSYSRDIIFFELFINWSLPIILVEGVFDALTIKRNCIPLLGKTFSKTLLKTIIENKTDKIYICLDKDAIKQSLNHCETLLNMGKETYLVELPSKDVNELGFDKFLEIIENTVPLRYEDIILKRLELI